MFRSDSVGIDRLRRMNAVAARVDRLFAWRWKPQIIAGQTIDIATPSDPDDVLGKACRHRESLLAREDETTLADPFWAQVWHSTAGFDAYWGATNFAGTRVLELGCGTGVGGLAAALRGAHVTFTDGATAPLLLVRLTLDRHALHHCRIQRLRFGIDIVKAAKFPLIVASDITYLKVCWPGIVNTLDRHLARGGEVLLGDPFRSVSSEFCLWAIERGWQVDQFRIDLVDAPVRMIRLTRTTS